MNLDLFLSTSISLMLSAVPIVRGVQLTSRDCGLTLVISAEKTDLSFTVYNSFMLLSGMLTNNVELFASKQNHVPDNITCIRSIKIK